MKLVMTLLVRDEADVLEANLRFHFAAGVDFVVATDNGSRDGSREILERYARAGLAHVIDEPSDDAGQLWGRWITRMARLAANEFGADWVINNDADEFWWPVQGSLPEAFASIPEFYGALAAPRPEFVARPPAPGRFEQRMTVRERHSRTFHKLAHRGIGDIHVSAGSHRIGSGEPGSRDIQRRGRAVLRPLREPPGDGGLVVAAPVWPVRVLHFPLRSPEQFRARVERLIHHEALSAKGERGSEVEQLRVHLEQGRLDELYAREVASDADVREGLASGRLVTDTRLRDYLPQCPDPSDGKAAALAAVAVPVPADGGAADLGELAEDMMQSLTRSEHILAAERRARRHEASAQAKPLRQAQRQLARAERRLHAQEERNARLTERLAAVEGSRWWRLGTAGPRALGALRRSRPGPAQRG